MAGLDPAIQSPTNQPNGCVWMPGSRPGMTRTAQEFSRPIEKPRDEGVDFLRDARLGERGADQAARALEFYGFGQRDGRGDGLRLSRGLGDGDVEWISRIETRNGQIEDHLVEIPRAKLAAGLPRFAACARRFAVEKSGEITSFFFG